ncbi:MAG: hypothetical protein ACYCXT_00105 [Acidiferrobacteraceae bacterium]
MEPRKLTARVARYLSAIERARARGFTWSEIARVVDASSGAALRAAARRARSAVAAGRLTPGAQQSLPELEPAQEKTE